MRFLDGSTGRPVGEVAIRRMHARDFRSVASIAEMPPGSHASWEMFKLCVAFGEQPSKARLAAAVRMTAELGEDAKPPAIPSLISWPLEECLLTAFADGSGAALAKSIEAGVLGDVNDWSKWEDLWVSKGVPAEQFLSDISEIAKGDTAVPWFPCKSSAFRISLHEIGNSTLEPMFHGRTAAIKSALVTGFFGGRNRFGRRRSGELPVAVIEGLLEMARQGSFAILDDIASWLNWNPPLEERVAAAFAEGVSGSDAVYGIGLEHGLGKWALAAMIKFPHISGLLPCIAGSTVEFSRKDIAAVDGMDLEGAHPLIRSSRAIILIQAGKPLEYVLDDVSAALADDSIDIGLLLAVLGQESVNVGRQVSQLMTIYQLVVGSPKREASVLVRLRVSLRRRQSELIDESRWEELGFMKALRGVIK